MTPSVSRHTDEVGRTIFSPSSLAEAMLCGVDPVDLLTEISDEVAEYNRVCIERDKTDFIRIVSELADNDAQARCIRWNIPEPFATVDVRAHFIGLCRTTEQHERVIEELALYEERGLFQVLKSALWIVDHLRKHQIVWGVGRGSSVSSYCLYLAGLHKIDSLRYDLSIREFLR